MQQNVSASCLQGIKIVDLSRVLGGPYATQILGDFGADVIKVEPPSGDETRGWGPPFHQNRASYFIGVNRNKTGIKLDLSQKEGQRTLYDMLEEADILVENFKIGTMEKWGLDYETLKQTFPKLIYCRITGFGAEGPYAKLPGYDAVAQALSGLMSVNGENNGPPLRLGVPIIDLASGLNAVIGILLALYERARSGLGQCIEVSLFDTGVSLLHPQAANWFLNKKPYVRSGNAHPNICPYSLFATQKGYIFIGCGNDKQFKLLSESLHCPELNTDSRFLTNALRLENRPALEAIITNCLQQFEAETLAAQLLQKGVPAGQVLSVEEVLTHPQTIARNMVIQEQDYCGVASPIKLSRTPAKLRHLPPL